MNTSENGIAFIKSEEGFCAIPYIDNGKWAWGYGHDQQPGEPLPVNISISDGDRILRRDLAARIEPPLNRYLSEHDITLTQNQWDAWADMAYNDGPADAITMIAHGIDQVPVQILRWVYEHVNGVAVKSDALEKRREAELALWNKR